MNNTAFKLPIVTDKDITAFYSQVFKQCLKHLRHLEDAEDAAQLTIFKACQNKDKFKGDSKLSSWLFRIAFNECNMLIRRKNVYDKKIYTLKTSIIEKSYTQRFRDPFIIEELQETLNSIPKRHQEALVHHQIQRLESAKKRTYSSLKSDLHRARKPFLQLVK
jgi:RNA polymerase sigma factor (sigma-70 family)